MARHPLARAALSAVLAAAAAAAPLARGPLLAAPTPAPTRAPTSTADAFTEPFDCAMRLMVLEAAYALQPDRPAALFSGLADALNGSPEKPANCSVTAPPPVLAATAGNGRTAPPSRAALAARAVRGGLSVFVDPVRGSDGNDGSEGSPLKSIPAALAKTRAAPGGRNTVVLRGGTHYLPATQVLTPADSGLAIVGFPGDALAWVSGGLPLAGLTWAPFNVSTSPPSWEVFDGLNVVSGCCSAPGASAPGVPFLGYLATSDACLAACNATAGCTAWTWHDSAQGEWSHCCYGRTDGSWAPTSESGHVSGHLPPAPNVWSASLAPLAGVLPPYGVLGMRGGPDGARLQRARYPNWNSEVSFGPSFMAGWTPQWAPRAPALQVDIPNVRNNTPSLFHNWTAGYGGTCEGRFDPPAGYFCSQAVQGGGSQVFFAPIAMNVSTVQLPHTPYANPAGGIIMTWRPGHWASWMAEIGAWDYDAATGATNFTIARGLFQGSRGADTGDEVYIENVWEELDAPGEWFYNATTNTLYLWNNATAPAPPGTDVYAVGLKHLFNVTGTQAAPVTDVSFVGVGFRDTALTYMDPHGMPSGGDWSLERSAVLFAEGTVGLAVSGCVFERVDGNAVVLSAYTRNATITHNEFAWLGSSAVALWGNTYDPQGRLPPGYGYDGSSGDQPRGVEVAFNWAHELGIWQKQVGRAGDGRSGRGRAGSRRGRVLPELRVSLDFTLTRAPACLHLRRRLLSRPARSPACSRRSSRSLRAAQTGCTLTSSLTAPAPT
jgi:hypothetical protein